MLEFFTKRNSELTRLSTAIEAILDKTAAPQPSQDDFATTSKHTQDLILRVEALELSNEQLREECLRHLRKASQRMKRAEEISEDEAFEESAPAVMPEQLSFPEQSEQVDFSWARQQIRQRGETPV